MTSTWRAAFVTVAASLLVLPAFWDPPPSRPATADRVVPSASRSGGLSNAIGSPAEAGPRISLMAARLPATEAPVHEMQVDPAALSVRPQNTT